MAAAFLAPMAPLVPVFKVLALGSVKFIGVGIGAAVAPVTTANFLVGLSAGTPLKYAKFRHSKGHFSSEQLELINSANKLVEASISDSDQHLTRSEAREFLKEVLVGTVVAMKQSVVSIPGRVAFFTRRVIVFCKRPFSSHD